MNRAILSSLWCSLVAVVSACSSGETEPNVAWQSDLPTRQQTWDQFRAERTRQLQDGTIEYVLVDDVISHNVQDLRSYYDDYVMGAQNKSVGIKVGGNWVKWNKHLLSYCVASDTNWGTPIDPNRRNYIRALIVRGSQTWPREANIAWVENNTLGSSCETSEPTGGHVDFVVAAGVSGYGGYSFYPDALVASRIFHINTGIFDLPTFTDWINSGVIVDPSFIVHELGHISGLDHEYAHSGTWNPSPPVMNPPPRGTPDPCADKHGSNADLTTNFDYCSVMASYACEMTYDWQVANCPGRFVTFTTPSDDYGIRSLYGIPDWYATMFHVPFNGM